MGDAEPIEVADLDVLAPKPKGGRPKGYVPLRSNASVAVTPLPEDYVKYREPPPTASDVPVYAPFKNPAALPVEEGSVAAKTVKKEREKKAMVVPEMTFKAKTASDVMVRADPVTALFKSVKAAAKEARLNPDTKESKAAMKRAELYAPYKDDFQEQIANKKKYPLVSYQEKQKENEEAISQYAKDVQIYMPSTRKAFYNFIQDNYTAEFTLTRVIKDPDPKACEALMKGGPASVEPFRYQRFVKEYIRQSSPYRGILVFHGLGSGKTCSSIAAAEALYGIANKRIIVMTPQSLRDNFIKEISFCGFRHFSLQNHWIKIPLFTREYNKKERKIENTLRPLYEIYGRSVLSLSEDYIRKLKDVALRDTSRNEDGDVIANAYIWVPDFEEKPNFDLPRDEGGLTPSEKDLVKAQLNETINNRFHFINYNGITNAELLKKCCQGDAFDNAVIVIDEIHNLTRLMRGKIDPYLIERTGRERTVKVEPVKPGRWEPALCIKGKKGKYSRGYMFYRLLIGAKNSKIIGLSGTPLINFPEELGVLTNVLAGYIDCIELEVDTVDPTKIAQFEEIANRDSRIDFVRLEAGKGVYNATLSLFQEGYLKVLKEGTTEFLGVQHSSDPEAQMDVVAVTKRLIAKSAEKGIEIDSETVKYVSHPRLPPDQDSFRARFVDVANQKLREENKLVLRKRLMGVISYYKGAKPDFLPKVTSDVLVECDFSTFALQKYVDQRAYEISKEANKEIADSAEAIYAAVEAYTKSPNPSSYRFRSRACCNFVFPFDRPYPVRAEDLNEETEVIDNLDEDDLEQDRTEEEEADRQATKKAIQEEEDEIAQEEEGEFKPVLQKIEVAVVAPATAIAKDYGVQKREAMLRLNAERDTYLKLEDPANGLKKYSAKLYEILTRMEVSPGPALVYSQFEELEGLGVLAAALQANGYEEIKFTGAWFKAEPEFTEESKASLRKGPAEGVKRFISFTGKVDRRQRRVILGMFNNQWRDVPKGIQKFLKTCGFDMSKMYLHGEVLKCIGITGAGAEGISLRNVRQVHIMEPFWNLVRLEQVKGRAIRICSHMDLPVDERKVDIFTYVSRFSDEQIEKRDMVGGVPLSIQSVDGDIDPETKTQRIMTSDQRVLNVAIRKEQVAKELLDIMKEVAVDCALNAADNTVDNEPLTCYVIEEGTNPYMFEPNINDDEITTGAETNMGEEKKAVGPGKALEDRTSLAATQSKPSLKPVTTARRLELNVKGVQRYILVGEKEDPKTGIIFIYDQYDTGRKKPIGKAKRSGRSRGLTILEIEDLPTEAEEPVLEGEEEEDVFDG